MGRVYTAEAKCSTLRSLVDADEAQRRARFGHEISSFFMDIPGISRFGPFEEKKKMTRCLLQVDREAVDEEVHSLDFLVDSARRVCRAPQFCGW